MHALAVGPILPSEAKPSPWIPASDPDDVQTNVIEKEEGSADSPNFTDAES